MFSTRIVTRLFPVAALGVLLAVLSGCAETTSGGASTTPEPRMRSGLSPRAEFEIPTLRSASTVRVSDPTPTARVATRRSTDLARAH